MARRTRRSPTTRTKRPARSWIGALKGDQVIVMGDHPMAGQRLNFAIEVLDVRRATKDEKQHGHVHGPGGHQH